ncbi:MAG: hypothetical protein OEY14_13795 [Myxococcales bacterium]|nr:hypothetical protein [Myxococcales bacterium]
MAHDKSAPRNGLIGLSIFMTAFTLVALIPVFNSYWSSVVDPLVRERSLDSAGLDPAQAREAQRDQLESSPLPIDRAMEQLGSRGRRVAPQITPRPSEDVAAVEGWGQRPNEEGAAAARAAWEEAHRPPEPEPEPATIDGGVSGDAAAPSLEAAAPVEAAGE